MFSFRSLCVASRKSDEKINESQKDPGPTPQLRKPFMQRMGDRDRASRLRSRVFENRLSCLRKKLLCDLKHRHKKFLPSALL
jgi:hypothetical protein